MDPSHPSVLPSVRMFVLFNHRTDLNQTSEVIPSDRKPRSSSFTENTLTCLAVNAIVSNSPGLRVQFVPSLLHFFNLSIYW